MIHPAILASGRRRRSGPTFIAAGEAYAGLGGISVDVPFCDGATGDLLIMAVTVRGSVTIETPSGWSLVVAMTIGFTSTSIFRRAQQPGDGGAVTVTTNAAGSQTTVGQMFSFRGAQTLVVGDILTDTGNVISIGPVPGIAVRTGAYVFALGSRANDWATITTLSGDGLTWVQVGNAGSESGGDAGQVVEVAKNETGATVDVSDKTWTCDEIGRNNLGVMIEVST